MILYYTNSEVYNTPQNIPNKSLGGFLSSSPIPNGEVNSLFDIVSFNSLSKNSFNVVGIMLKNTTNGDINNIKFYFNETGIENNIYDYKIGLAQVVNINNQEIMEKISNSQSIPYNSNLDICYGINQALILTELKVGKSVGIWLKREIKNSKIEELFSDIKVEERFLEGSNFPSQEDIQLKIEW